LEFVLNIFGAIFGTSEIYESLLGFFWASLLEEPTGTVEGSAGCTNWRK